MLISLTGAITANYTYLSNWYYTGNLDYLANWG